MSVKEDKLPYEDARISKKSFKASADPYRAVYTPSIVTQKPGGPTYVQPNIEVRQKPLWRHKIELDWNKQIGPMMVAMDLDLPNSITEHRDQAKAMAVELRRWAHTNLKGQIDISFSSAFVPELTVWLEYTQDVVRFKLTWWNL